MAVQVSYPGVYVQEVPSGVRTIVGVSTSIAVFIGRAKQGPLNEPIDCVSLIDYERVFSREHVGSDMSRSVRLFFQNGGTRCYAMRTANGAESAAVTLKNESDTPVLKVIAKSPGVIGNKIRLAVTYNGSYPESTFNLEIFRWDKNSIGADVKAGTENWTRLSMDPKSPRYAIDFINQNSKLVELEEETNPPPAPADHGYSQSGRATPAGPSGIFWEFWRKILVSVGLARQESALKGTSEIKTSGIYTGNSNKTFTFTVDTGGTVGAAPIKISWGAGANDKVDLAPNYAGAFANAADGIQLSFEAGPGKTLVTGQKFTVSAHPPTDRFRISVDGSAFTDVDLSGFDFDGGDPNLTETNAITHLEGSIQTRINTATGSNVTASFENGPDSPLSEPGPAVMGTPWTGNSPITTSGLYTGHTNKIFTFNVEAGTGGVIGTDNITIHWDDGTNSDAFDVTTVGDTIDVGIEGLELTFGAGNLNENDVFTVEVNRTNNMLRIVSTTGDIKIEPSTSNDLTRTLMLGTAQGGIEVSRYAQCRPAPTGIVLNPGDDVTKLADLTKLVTFGEQLQDAFNVFRIDTTDINLANSLINVPPITDGRMYQDDYSPSYNGKSDGIRQKLSIIADAINKEKVSNPKFRWSAEVWGSRLALIPGEGGDNSQGNVTTNPNHVANAYEMGDIFTKNVRYYSLGITGIGHFQTGVAGEDGTAPTLSDYDNAFTILDKQVDLFNLMILPKDDDYDDATIASLWGPASIFCQKRRAFLLMDPPSSWVTAQTATSSAKGVNSLRIGLVKDHSAIFYPRLIINEDGREHKVGPSGAIAGLMARTDNNRGVWKAPAGTEADIRDIKGLEYKFSDGENGVLNPHAINTLRVFPNGVVNWGARTMDGDDDFASEYKYIPVRRLALFLEESLYRGLKWVVFEPNDEPLWAQIRLNVGAFMHNLFRQGAFQGKSPRDAYLVKCDKETTTQNDINLGIVNIWVGFAPLKPAEFVILYLQQMAGQIEV